MVAPIPTPSPAEAEASPNAESLPSGALFAERYRIDRLIGEGSSGKVYAAEHVLLRKKLAIKVLHRGLATSPNLVRRFEREALASAHLEHPNIAAAIDFGKLDDGSLFLALEYVEGRTLRDELGQGPLSLGRSLHIARQIASALERARELGIVHRDLKPENVMLVQKADDVDFVKVLDFGIARLPASHAALGTAQPLTRAGVVFGTPEYMAPEQALGQEVDGRADLYALGVILYEMLTGARPYEATDQRGILLLQIAGAPPKMSRPGLPQIPDAVEELVARLLQREAGARFQLGSEVVSAIDDIGGGAPARGVAFTPSLGTPEPAAGSASAHSDTALAAPLGAASVEDRRIPTFLPNDPLPAFALPAEAEIEVEPLTLLGAPKLAPEPPTLLRATSAPFADPSAAPHPAAAKPAAAQGPTPLRGSVDALRAALSRIARKALDGTRKSYREACAYIDAQRQRLPPKLRESTARVSAPALLGAFAALGVSSIVLSGLAAHALRDKPRERAIQAAAPAASAALPAATVSARAAESAEVPRPLADPQIDASTLLDLASERAHDGRDADAVAFAGRALTMHPSLRDDPRVAPALYKGALSDDRNVSAAAFALLEGTMAGRGADVIYRLSLDRSARENVRHRAEKWLHSPDFERAASGPLASAVKLRYAETCSEKHELLNLAGKVGARQTLDYLHELEQKSGCGLNGDEDCYACLRKDDRLKQAIVSIEKRGKH